MQRLTEKKTKEQNDDLLNREVKSKQPPLKTLKKILKIKIEQNVFMMGFDPSLSCIK
jgi:hypothetical protein